MVVIGSWYYPQKCTCECQWKEGDKIKRMDFHPDRLILEFPQVFNIGGNQHIYHWGILPDGRYELLEPIAHDDATVKVIHHPIEGYPSDLGPTIDNDTSINANPNLQGQDELGP